ncbi:MAG: S8 family serine peptidase [Gammaproteobacteria bacterium]|nr:S8 family serine peptidase [Gammaproteobacteria bacterium]MDH3757100.1 S8 family serine peptidase [Gammaproteobacteria bacterium]MDH3863766.1 S8 family serine peptidase [Gammaproteobacteria bacterium]MDH3904558.1 S8 family serine peptidase [Gammaproteobacteria bacterium]MDH4003751.1 S8 family serine peptidase [Gammaproteobacteria bacterium]
MKLIILLTSFCLSLCAISAHAGNDSPLHDAGIARGLQLAGNEDPDARKVYIVQLRTPSAAEYYSALRQTTATLPVQKLPRVRFDKARPAVASYAEKLRAEQEELLVAAAPDAEKIYSYRYGFNGFAAEMTATQAHKLENMPQVLHVWEDEIRPLATNFSPNFLGLFDGERGLRGPEGLDGDGVVIGFIDSGIYPEHPALEDTQEADRPSLCRSTWAEVSFLGRWLCRRFDKREDKLVFEPPENWNGICETGENFDETLCNNKLIGARYFIAGAENSGPIDGGEIRSARDVDGHGTHTATTAAGNRVQSSIFGTVIGNVEGVAPRARVAVYKACWLRPGDTRASCNTSDLASAIDSAVADGVDIINYSVGSSMLQISAPDDIALMNATKAGVLAVVAAGNEGPNLGTIGSPAGGPWAITVGASTRDGETSIEAMQINEPPSIAGKYAVKEANFTPPLRDSDAIEAPLILADDGDDASGTGTIADACEPLINDTEISGNIAFIERGGCNFDVKIQNAGDAGAVAAVVYSIAGDPIVMNGNSAIVDIPALMIGQADGNLIVAEIEAGNDVNAVLEKSLLLTEPETGNVMATFSARGPGPVRDLVKPDVTAPGVNILAGFTPETANSMPDETFAYLSGTSMSTPHVAGVAALVMQANPEWGPSSVKSALMTSARQDLVQADGEGAANPFDYGAGHIVPNDAVKPGLVYDVSDDEFDAFACGTDSPAVPESRCNELEGAGVSFAPEDLNQPSIGLARLANEQTVTRRVTNVSEESQTFVASVTAPPGIQVAVAPSSLSLGPGQTATFDVSMVYESGPLDLWRFGSLTWTSNDHSIYSTIAVKPTSLTAPAEVTSFGGSGSISFSVEFGYTGAYGPGVHGLRLPLVIDGFVDNDPTKTFTFRSGNGVTPHLVQVPAEQLYLRFSLFDRLTEGNDDLDLYLYYQPGACNPLDFRGTRITESGGPTSEEQVNVFRPQAGCYGALVHGFETDPANSQPGTNYTMLAWAIGIVDDQGNMTASGPPFVNSGSTETITVNWANLLSDTIYLGGISHNTPQGLVGLTLVTIGN